jgi:hypothetical protein
MALGEELQKKLKKKFEPSAMVSMKYKGNDLEVKTDSDGNAVLLFIGRRKDDDTISGERYTRTLKYDREGKVIKDHWDLKGKTT